jgi:hypothetical protein
MRLNMVMRTVSIPQMILLMRWAQVPLFVVWVAIVCYVRYYFNTGRLWLAWTVCGLRAFALILSFTTGQNLFFQKLPLLSK